VCLFAYLYFIVGVLTTNFQYFDAYLKSKFWIWKHFLINILFSNFILEVIHYQRNWFFLAWLIILLIGSNPFFNTWFPYLKFALIHNTSNDDNHSQTTEITLLKDTNHRQRRQPHKKTKRKSNIIIPSKTSIDNPTPPLRTTRSLSPSPTNAATRNFAVADVE